MAKDEPSGDYEFQPPNFDEDAFIHRELVSFRSTAILFVWGIVAALVSWALYMAIGGGDGGWWLGLLLCGAFGYALKFIFPKLGADVSHFKRKEWLGTGFLFFCTWLSFFILAINPPVTDLAAPQVSIVASPPSQQAGADLRFDVLVTDNDRIEGTPTIDVRRGADPVTAQVTQKDGNLYEVLVPTAAAGEYTVTAKAHDARGHEAEATYAATVGNVLQFAAPQGIRNDVDRVVVTIPDMRACHEGDRRTGAVCVRFVELRPVQGGEPVRLEAAASSRWVADAQHKGWVQGNHSYKVVAGFLDQFVGAHRVSGGELTLPDAKAIEVTAPTGDKVPGVVEQPPQRTIPLPAPAFLAVVVGVLGAAMVARARRGA